MIYPNPFDGYKNHPENDEENRNFTELETLVIQETSDALRDFLDDELEASVSLKFNSKAFRDTITVQFKVYCDDSKQCVKKILALLDRNTCSWVTLTDRLNLNELFTLNPDN